MGTIGRMSWVDEARATFEKKRRDAIAAVNLQFEQELRALEELAAKAGTTSNVSPHAKTAAPSSAAHRPQKKSKLTATAALREELASQADGFEKQPVIDAVCDKFPDLQRKDVLSAWNKLRSVREEIDLLRPGTADDETPTFKWRPNGTNEFTSD